MPFYVLHIYRDRAIAGGTGVENRDRPCRWQRRSPRRWRAEEGRCTHRPDGSSPGDAPVPSRHQHHLGARPPEPDAEVVRRLRENEAAIALAAPVWHELVHGAELLERPEKRRTIEHYLANVVRPSFPILPYDELAADWHARERARLTKARSTVR